MWDARWVERWEALRHQLARAASLVELAYVSASAGAGTVGSGFPSATCVASPSASAVDMGRDANFQAEVRDADSPVLVDVWAEWCGPCRLMAPMMDAMAAEYVGRLTVGKLEADPNPITRDGLQIQGLPTLILFRDGQELARHEGAMAKAQLKAFLDAHL